MKIKVKLLSSTYYFLSDITLTKEGGETELDLEGRSDHIIRSLAVAVRGGTLSCDKTFKELVDIIQDQEIRVSTQMSLGLPVAEFTDTVKAGPFTVASVEEKEKEVEVVIEVDPDTEDEDPAETDPTGEEEEDDLLDVESFLKGNSKSVIISIKKSDLTDAQRKALIEKEGSGANRSSVIRQLKG